MSITAQDPTLLCNVSVHDPADSDEDLTSLTCRQLLVKDLFPDASASHDKIQRFHERPPEIVGNYELIKVLGQGSTGVVWQAVHLGSVQREVALKIMHADRHDQHALVRFAGEVRALTALDHPNIAKVWEYGSTPFDQPYLAMELIVGQSLVKYAETWSLPLHERIRLMIAVCRGVQHAHQRGILHRDLKPANILVALQDGVAIPKVIDFGLAKSLHGPLIPSQIETTQRGSLLGTIGYMSPEQADLDQDKVDTRSDVHALTAVLYEMLTGTLPIPKEELHRRNLGDALELIRKRDPELPSRRVARLDEEICQSARCQLFPGQLRLRLKGDLDAILLKGLAKEPAQRYQSADELANDLESYLAGGIVQARRRTYWYVVQKLVRNHWKLASLVMAFALTIILGLIGTSWALVWALEERDHALSATTQMRDAREKEREFKEDAELYGAFLSDVLAFVRPVGEKGHGQQVTLIESLDAAAQTISTRFAHHPRVESLAHLALARSYLSLGRSFQAKRHTLTALAILAPRQNDFFQEFVQAKMILIETHTMMNELDEAEKEYRLLLEHLTTKNPATATEARKLQRLFKNILVEQHKYEQAENVLFEMASQDRDSTKRPLAINEDVRFELIMLYLSWGERDSSKWTRAEELIDEMSKERESDHYDVLQLSNLRAYFLAAQGRYKQAEVLFRQILEVSSADPKIQNDHIFRLAVQKNRASNLQNLGRDSEAEGLLKQAFTSQKAALGLSHQYTQNTLQALIQLYEDLGMTAHGNDALEYLDQMITGQQESLDMNHPAVIRTALRRIYLLNALGKWEENKAFAYSISQIIEGQPISDDATLAQCKALLALAKMETGSPLEAASLFDAANTLARKTNRADIVAIVQNHFGWYLHRADRSSEAGYLLLTSLQNLPKDRMYLELGINRLVQFYQDVGNLQQRDQWLWNLAEMKWKK